MIFGVLGIFASSFRSFLLFEMDFSIDLKRGIIEFVTMINEFSDYSVIGAKIGILLLHHKRNSSLVSSIEQITYHNQSR